jgi:hypothetical protein
VEELKETNENLMALRLNKVDRVKTKVYKANR